MKPFKCSLTKDEARQEAGQETTAPVEQTEAKNETDLLTTEQATGKQGQYSTYRPNPNVRWRPL